VKLDSKKKKGNATAVGWSTVRKTEIRGSLQNEEKALKEMKKKKISAKGHGKRAGPHSKMSKQICENYEARPKKANTIRARRPNVGRSLNYEPGRQRPMYSQ